MKNMTGNSGISYKPIELSEFQAFYPDYKLERSIRGMAFYLNGELSGVAGVKYEKGFFYGFYDMKENVNINKQTMWRCALLFKSFIKSMGFDVYACANESIARAPLFLSRLGFKKLDGLYVLEAT